MFQVSKPSRGIKLFYSYSHKDEWLRNELADHMSILRREGAITEWHDRRISAGDEWAGTINQHLNTADIILLLISADFLASDYSYDVEVKRAMKRHELGEARVIPIILRPVAWQGALFGKLQALPKDARPVTIWNDRDEAFLNVVEGIRQVAREIQSQRQMVAKQLGGGNKPIPIKQLGGMRKPRTWIVDQQRHGDFVTITDAIKGAQSGDQIFVRPGVYREGLVIDKQLHIIGDGKVSEIIIQASGKNVVLSRTDSGRLANLTLQQLGGGRWFCVDITQGFLDILACDITSESLACVGIHDGAEACLRRNRIHNSNESGVVLFKNAKGRLEGNEVFSNKCVGIKVTAGSNATLVSNRVYGNQEIGILICDDAQGILEVNDIFNNIYAGVEITSIRKMDLRRNRVYDGKKVV